MNTDDLRTRAREAAAQEVPGRDPGWMGKRLWFIKGYHQGYLAHAAQQPTREQVARALYLAERGTTLRPGVAEKHWDEGAVGSLEDEYYRLADAVLALFDGADLIESEARP